MGETFVDAPFEQVVALLRDVASQPRWMDSCRQARVVRTIDRYHLIAYNLLRAPWPYRDRDFVADVRFSHDPRRCIARIEACSDPAVAPSEGLVRITELSAVAMAERVSSQITRATFVRWADPRVAAPLSAVNRASVNNVLRTLQGLQRHLARCGS